MTDSPSMSTPSMSTPSLSTPSSLSLPVPNLLTHLPHPTVTRSNLSPPQSSTSLPTPHLPPPPTTVASHLHHHRPIVSSNHHYTQPTYTHQLRPSQHTHTSTQVTTPQLTNSHVPAFPSVLSSQSPLPRQICNPIANQIPALHRPLDLRHPPLHSAEDHPRPELPRQPNKYRRLEATTHVSPVRLIEQPSAPVGSRPQLSVMKSQYDTTISTRDDGYSTGSRETAPAPDGLEDDHDVEAPYTCAHCAARFPDKEQRKLHIKTNHEKPFVCPSCNSRFTRKFDLEKHSLTVHEGMRPFQCDICNACFGQKHHLVRHKRAVHAKARDFACDACNSKFARKEHLANHKRAVHEKHKPYMCPLCDVQYYERRALRRHLEHVHSVKSSRASVFVEWQPNGSGSAPSIQELVQM